jgi:hypothetical protein
MATAWSKEMQGSSAGESGAYRFLHEAMIAEPMTDGRHWREKGELAMTALPDAYAAA